MNRKIITGIVLAAVVAVGIWSMYAYHGMKVDQFRAAGVKALRASVNMDAYGKKEQKKIEAILAEDEEKIMQSSDKEEIDRIAKSVEVDIADIPTIDDIRKDGRKKLKKLVSLSDYREEQQKEVKAILKDAKKKINKSKSKKKNKKILKEAKDEIAKIKTDKQLTAEEQAAYEAWLEQQRQAAAAAAARKKSSGRSGGSKKKSRGSEGCVGNDAKNFY